MKKLLAASALCLGLLSTVAAQVVEYMYYLNENNNVVTKLYMTKCYHPAAPEGWMNLEGVFPEDFPSAKAGTTVKGCWKISDGTISIVVDDGSQKDDIDPSIFKPGPVPALKPIQQGKTI